jgi:aspartyl-tRNA(Asn)/glutamyl-tRNA(Gln) amidotransferase subunit B
VDAGADAKEAANVLANQFVATGIAPEAVSAPELAKLVAARGQIPRATFDEALAHVGDPGFSADPFVAQKAVSEASELDPVIDRVIEANPAQAEQYRGGKQGLLGFFVGQVMKETQGKADARVVNERVREKLG